jgi:hypothetical protein
MVGGKQGGAAATENAPHKVAIPHVPEAQRFVPVAPGEWRFPNAEKDSVRLLDDSAQ